MEDSLSPSFTPLSSVLCSLSSYRYLCSLTVMAIITKSSRTLSIFIHPKIGIIYTPYCHFYSTQIRVSTKYFQLKLKFTPQLPTLSLSSTCSMNVHLHVFAPHIARCCPFNPTSCLLLVSIPFGSSLR